MSVALDKKSPKLRIPKTPLVFFLSLIEKIMPFKLPLTLSRIHFLTKTSTYSVEKFMNRFSWVHSTHHIEAIPECVQLWQQSNADKNK